MLSPQIMRLLIIIIKDLTNVNQSSVLQQPHDLYYIKDYEYEISSLYSLI